MTPSVVQIVSGIVQSIYFLKSFDSPQEVITPSFYYGTKAYQNLKGDDQVFPAVFLDSPIKYTFEVQQSGYIRFLPTLELFFIDKTTLDPSEEELNTVEANMLSLVKSFLIAVQNHSMARLSFDYPYPVSGYGFSSIFDVNVAGIAITLSLELVDDNSFCE